MIGKSLGHYRVGEQLGRGGMGEVYSADDLNLNRKVALKFIPEAFTGDPERMARFEREAKLLASLNHPNIAAIYGLEQAEGKRFIVMELVEGETLAERIARAPGRAPLQIDEALTICAQIAEGLEAAHEKGVIHRDLKPANVMITEGGKVKILDFGLAKALSGETQSVDSSHSPTITEAMTRPGIVLGTAAYMSPEQAKGKAVDKRADIWAFGCILYESLTGKRVFEGETVTETLAGVLTKEPEWEKIPAGLRSLLRRCLEKDPNRRVRDIVEAMAWIESAPESAPTRRPRLLWTWAAVATLLMLALAIPAYLYFGGREDAGVISFQISAPRMPDDYSLAISPDGRTIAFVDTASNAAAPSLFVRRIDSVTPMQLDGTEGAEYPFWSPDGRSIAYFGGGRLRRVELSGGPSRDICAAENLRGGSWNKDGVILFGAWPILRRVPASGGDPVTVTSIDKSSGEIAHFYPCFLPDGRHYLYEARFNTSSRNGIYVGSIESQEKKRLLTGESTAVYTEPGYVLFQRDGTLFARPFDVKKLEFTGEEAPIAHNVIFNMYGWAGFSASQKGELIYRTGQGQARSQFIWLDRTGKPLGPAGESGNYTSDFALSPDGKQIAMKWRDSATSNYDIRLLDWSRGVSTLFTGNPAVEEFPIWSPEGSRVAFTSHRNGNADIFEKKIGSVSEETALLSSPDNEWTQSWSKDGRYIAFITEKGLKWSMRILPLFGDRKPFPIVQTRGIQGFSNFSFDGKWLAYASNESGRYEVYVISFPAADRKIPISSNGGVEPRWRQDGKELYYLALDGKLMAVDLSGETEIVSGPPHVLFDAKVNVTISGGSNYAVTRDGQRFLLLKPLAEASSAQITVVLNWTALLKE